MNQERNWKLPENRNGGNEKKSIGGHIKHSMFDFYIYRVQFKEKQ